MEPSDAFNLKSSISIDPSRDQELYPTILIPSVPSSCGYRRLGIYPRRFRVRVGFPSFSGGRVEN